MPAGTHHFPSGKHHKIIGLGNAAFIALSKTEDGIVASNNLKERRKLGASSFS